MKQKEEENQLKECSHQPKVNEISGLIVEYKRKDHNKKVENFLLDYMEYKKNNLNKAKKDKIEQEMKECSFHPKINQKFLSEKKSSQKANIYEDLFNDHRTNELKRAKKAENIYEKYTFKPEINQNYVNKFVEDFDFLQRMQLFDSIKKQKLERFPHFFFVLSLFY